MLIVDALKISAELVDKEILTGRIIIMDNSDPTAKAREIADKILENMIIDGARYILIEKYTDLIAAALEAARHEAYTQGRIDEGKECKAHSEREYQKGLEDGFIQSPKRTMYETRQAALDEAVEIVKAHRWDRDKMSTISVMDMIEKAFADRIRRLKGER